MKEYKTEYLRNIALVAHGGAGKTMMSEAFLHFTGATTRLGKVEDGTTASDYDEERSKLSRFIARTFRERILKEPSSADTPLKAYEIAEAGVTGLNKLLGWEMDLDERKDEKGELSSVYFNSKILKINAPVKKSEPLP